MGFKAQRKLAKTNGIMQFNSGIRMQSIIVFFKKQFLILNFFDLISLITKLNSSFKKKELFKKKHNIQSGGKKKYEEKILRV